MLATRGFGMRSTQQAAHSSPQEAAASTLAQINCGRRFSSFVGGGLPSRYETSAHLLFAAGRQRGPVPHRCLLGCSRCGERPQCRCGLQTRPPHGRLPRSAAQQRQLLSTSLGLFSQFFKAKAPATEVAGAFALRRYPQL